MKWFKQKSNIAIGILFLITFVMVLRNPIQYFPDSTGYLNMHIIRTPGYPLFLQGMQAIFGNSFDSMTIVIQTALCCFGIYYFVNKLRSYQLLNGIFSVGFAIVLLMPLVSGLKIANNLLTEAISYTLYLIIVANFIAFFISKNKKELLISIPILGLLLITRYQFIYLIPVALLLIFWIAFKQKSFKQYTITIILLLLLPLLTSLIDRTYHKIVHKHFVSTPWTGMNMITAAFFVADAEDETLFEDATQREFFKKTYRDLAEEKKNINHLDTAENQSPTQFYIQNFANITMGPIFKNGNEVLATVTAKNERYIALDKMTSNMTKPLIVDNFSKWISIYIKNAIHGFGGIKYILLYGILLVFSGISLLKTDHKIYKTLGLISVLLIANVLIVSIGMHAVIRFTFYNHWVLFLTMLILLNSLNKKLYES